MQHEIKIKKVQQDDKQIVFAEVYEPGVVDTHGHFMTAPEIEKMAHNFVKKGAMGNIDIQHDNKLYGCAVVETFIARKDDSVFIPDAWVIGVHVPDPVLWDLIKKGDLNGFSMEALVNILPESPAPIPDVTLPVVLKGYIYNSEKSDYGQSDSVTVFIDEEGNIAGNYSDDFIIEEIVELNGE